MKFARTYDDHDEQSRQAHFSCDPVSLTQQGYAEECDINWIVRTYGLADAAVPPAVLDPRYYGDFSEVPDLATALELVRDARVKFDALPVKLRNRFDNDPGRLWAFVNDPENADEAVRLGLLARAEVQPSGGPSGPSGAASGAPGAASGESSAVAGT